MLRLAIALVIAAATTFAHAEDVTRLPAESNASFTCRQLLVPQARTCVAGCDSSFAGSLQDDQRWSCTQACTVQGLWAMSACRAEVAQGTSVSIGQRVAQR